MRARGGSHKERTYIRRYCFLPYGSNVRESISQELEPDPFLLTHTGVDGHQISFTRTISKGTTMLICARVRTEGNLHG